MYHNVDVTVAVLVTVSGIVPETGVHLFVAVPVALLVLSLLRAHIEYLPLIRAFLICCSSLCSSWGLTQTALAKFGMVLNTLYLADELW